MGDYSPLKLTAKAPETRPFLPPNFSTLVGLPSRINFQKNETRWSFHLEGYLGYLSFFKKSKDPGDVGFS